MKLLEKEALTYNDVLIVPQYSVYRAKNVNLKHRLSKNIELSVPIMSAAMDTVTEAKMAIALARLGGLGTLHKSFSISEQINLVKKIKQSHSVLIDNPLTLGPENTVLDCRRLMLQNKLSGVPIIENKDGLENIIIGIVSKRDILFLNDLKLKLKHIMTNDVITIEKDFHIKEAEDLMRSYKIEKLPVVEKIGKYQQLVGLVTLRDVMNLKQFQNISYDTNGKYLVAAAVGANDYERGKRLIEDAKVDAVVLDSAHAHTPGMIKIIKYLKALKSSSTIIAGNVATPEATEDLIKAGADCIKVGIGPGAACTTRIVCGVGYPQFSATVNCSKVAKKYNVKVIADGGITYSGDIVKALGAGADCVMLGSVFAGCDESPGKVIMIDNKPFKDYRGMGSLGAMKRGSADIHFQEEKQISQAIAEGIESYVPYRGSVNDVLYQIIGGVKSAFSYIGAKTIADIHEKAIFVKISNSSWSESHPHGVILSHNSKNYQSS